MIDHTSHSIEPVQAKCQRLFWIADFAGKTDTTPAQRQVTDAELAKEFAQHNICKRKDGRLFSPTKYREGETRHNAAVEYLSAVVADVDGSDYEAVKDRLHGFRHWAYTTHSHGSEKGDRWRIVVPLERDVPASEWPAFYPAACQMLVGDHWDRSCSDASRMHYYPACHPDRSAIKRSFDVSGRFLDPDEIPIIEPSAPAHDFGDPADSPVLAVLTAASLDGNKHGDLIAFILWARKQGRSKTETMAVIQGFILRIDPARLGGETPAQAIEKYCREVDKTWAKFRPDSPGTKGPMSGVTLGWPKPLAAQALYGIAGDYVKRVEPYTQADPAAVLLQFLCFVGNAIGRARFVEVGPDRHHGNLYVMVVGRSANAGKGTSWGIVRGVASRVAPLWLEGVATGLSTREGLAAHCKRDEAIETTKEVLIVEPEFSNVLKNSNRDGNTITGGIRELWDSDTVQILTKSEPLRVSGIHLSIVGHITEHDLKRYLNACETSNGFGNRNLWCCSKKSKDVPLPRPINGEEFADLDSRLINALKFGREKGVVRFDDRAKEVWLAVYGLLNSEVPGLIGDMTARGAPQVLRLALNYSVLDRSNVITPDHLSAALAVWDYCDASVRYLFAERTDRLLNVLRGLFAEKDEVTKTDLYRATGSNVRKGDIEDVIAHLLALEEIVPVPAEGGAGRPKEAYRLARAVSE